MTKLTLIWLGSLIMSTNCGEAVEIKITPPTLPDVVEEFDYPDSFNEVVSLGKVEIEDFCGSLTASAWLEPTPEQARVLPRLKELYVLDEISNLSINPQRRLVQAERDKNGRYVESKFELGFVITDSKASGCLSAEPVLKFTLFFWGNEIRPNWPPPDFALLAASLKQAASLPAPSIACVTFRTLPENPCGNFSINLTMRVKGHKK